jgi:hypothetical protein
MSEQQESIDTEETPEAPPTMEELTSTNAFQRKYHKVLIELDALHRGSFDSDEAGEVAGLCLLAQAALITQQSSAEVSAKSLKRDIDFKKAEVYLELRNNPPDGNKKLTETALTNMVTQDAGVQDKCKEQAEAEKEAKEYTNILALLKDAHITFRAMVKKGV